MDPGNLLAKDATKWLPRLRGDGPLLYGLRVGNAVAAPPTRGWTPNPLPFALGLPGCPAYAGMDPVQKLQGAQARRLPRLRGDGPIKATLITNAGRAAPPTRGWTPDVKGFLPFF